MLDHFHILLTEPTSITVVFGWGAVVIDKKTGRIKKVVPEKIPPGGWSRALGGGAMLLRDTEGLRGVEELRLQAARLLVSLVETVAAQVASPKASKPDPFPLRGDVSVITDPEALKPDPDPWRGHVFVITDPGTATLVTGGFALVIDRETGQIIEIVPEMPILEEYGYAVAAVAALLRKTEGLKGVKDLRLQAARFLVSVTEEMATEVTTQIA